MIKKFPHLYNSKHLLFFTHWANHNISEAEMIYGLNLSDVIIFMSSGSKEEMLEKGIKRSIAHTLICGADSELFTPNKRKLE